MTNERKFWFEKRMRFSLWLAGEVGGNQVPLRVGAFYAVQAQLLKFADHAAGRGSSPARHREPHKNHPLGNSDFFCPTLGILRTKGAGGGIAWCWKSFRSVVTAPAA
jgi:hypothetical protein